MKVILFDGGGVGGNDGDTFSNPNSNEGCTNMTLNTNLTP